MMALYSSENCVDCHRVRFVLAEKGINVEIIHLEQDRAAIADLAELNPYGEAPTLVDRDMTVYGTGPVTEYLDERYPHPPLMPIDPVTRSRLRLLMYRIQRDWIDAGKMIESSTAEKKLAAMRKALKEDLIAYDQMFGLTPYLLNDELSLADCALLPMLWRLPYYGIELNPRQTPELHRYMDRLFRRDSFQRSLTEVERRMRFDD